MCVSVAVCHEIRLMRCGWTLGCRVFVQKNCGCSLHYSDIDECRLMAGACIHGRCINTMGSYRCLCDAGYQVDVAGTACVDVDECDAAGNSKVPCSHLCRNTDGSFACMCPTGYVLGPDARNCQDVDECSISLPRHDCSQGCVNTPGSFECRCTDGYRQSGSQCIGRCSRHCCSLGTSHNNVA